MRSSRRGFFGALAGMLIAPASVGKAEFAPVQETELGESPHTKLPKDWRCEIGMEDVRLVTNEKVEFLYEYDLVKKVWTETTKWTPL